jgi:hypothetical protein
MRFLPKNMHIIYVNDMKENKFFRLKEPPAISLGKVANFLTELSKTRDRQQKLMLNREKKLVTYSLQPSYSMSIVWNEKSKFFLPLTVL